MTTGRSLQTIGSVRKETLSGGAIRLSGTASSFLYQRLRPGILMTVVRGRDTGEFGATPLEIVEAECNRFQRPVYWYLDAAQVQDAAHTVFEQWTNWLRAQEKTLAQLHVLTGTDTAHMTISIARHLSDASRRMFLYLDRSEWTQALLRSSSGLTAAPELASRFDEPAISIGTTRENKDTRLTAPTCAFIFRRIADDTIFCRFEGADSGDLTDLALHEMERSLARSNGPVHWFLDLRDAHTVATDVSRTWTEWIGVHRGRFARISALSFAPLFPLVLTIAKFSSGTENVFVVHREIEPFRKELAARTSGAAIAAVGL